MAMTNLLRPWPSRAPVVRPGAYVVTVYHQAFYEHAVQRGRGFAFTCDATGAVDMSALSPAGKHNYHRCTIVDARDYLLPVVETTTGKVWDAGSVECPCGAEHNLRGHTTACACGQHFNASGQMLRGPEADPTNSTFNPEFA